MRLPQGKLKDTLKILLYEFVNSVEKVYSLHEESSLTNKEQLYSKILQTIEGQGKPQAIIDECEKILEHSYDEKMKNQCFEKDFSIQIHNPSVSKQSHSFDQSYCFDHRKDSFEESDEKLKKILFNTQQANQITQYNREPHQDFFVIENLVCEVKNQEISLSQEKVQERQSQNSESFYQQSDDSDYENSSSIQNVPKKQQPIKVRRNPKRSKITKKKYRSYTDDLRQQAVGHANLYGIDFTSKVFAIPKKNIVRWMKRKGKKQKIRGRKPGNPSMEENLTNWIKQKIKQGIYLTQTEIRNQARKFSGDINFKASKGWLEKYFRRNKMISDGLNCLLTTKRLKIQVMKRDEDLECKNEEMQ